MTDSYVCSVQLLHAGDKETWLYFMFIFIPSTGEALKDLKQHFLHLLDEMFRQFWLWHYSSLRGCWCISYSWWIHILNSQPPKTFLFLMKWKCWNVESLRNLFVLSSCFVLVVSLPTPTSLSDVINSSYSILWLWHMKIIKVNSEQKLHILHCFLSGNWYFIWELNTFLPPKIWWLGTF